MSTRKSSSSSNSPLEGDFPLFRWLGTIGIALFLIIFPYDRGLFNGYELGFESAIYGAVIYGFVLLLVIAALLFRSWRLNSYASILSIAVMALPIIYWLASFQAVSDYYAKFMTLIFFLLAALFVAGLYFAQSNQSRKIIEHALMLSSYIVVLFGLLNLFGQVYSRDALWLAHDGYRLTSVFQYSNTYAAFLAALFLVSLYYAVHCIRPSARIIHAAMLVPIWISFMFTYSRGAIVVIPVMVLILMPFLRLTKQIAYIAFMGLSVIISMAILGKLTVNADEIAKLVQPTAEKAQSPISLFSSLPLQCWGLLLLGIAVTTGLIMLYHAKVNAFLEYKLEKLSSRKWSFAAVPGLIIVVTAAAAVILLSSSAIRGMLPDKIASRFENINLQQHSVLERFTFYKDGLRVAQDYPLLGGGGGAWQAMYEQYQNNPYWSRQAHSFFVQVLVETGWIGLIALVLFLAFVYYIYIRSFIRNPDRRGSHIVFFILSLTLLIHSAIDFDMSYVFISALVFLSLGCMIAPFKDRLIIERFDKPASQQWHRFAYPSVLAVLSIVLLIMTVRETSAIQKYDKAFDLAVKQTPLNELLDVLNEAVKGSPKHTAFALTKADWLQQGYAQTNDQQMLTEALESLEQAKAYDPYNRNIIKAQYSLLQKNGQLEESLKVLDEGVTKFPWDINMYDASITSYAAAAKAAADKQDDARAQQYKDRIQTLSDEVQRRIDQLAALPPEQQQGRAFAFTPAMEQALAELAIAKNE
ncbi:O-antigen ligase family protein [Paenibacillus arenilitoris]|uniref:O-antigen ligase family protein n=1 Tax=Paenibacillus arenilitoris TaxID=2772299 RepID=A0A927CLA9_9BACL|nr:O-antigen ligase family protein [Paenibacillus arenilitoris]MBD2867956.1 O-antigen ligase family protein [Paenibacillus arenilitoris]